MKRLKKMLKKRWVIAGVIVLIILGVILVRRNTQKSTPRPVTATVTQGTITSTVSASGQVVASGRLEVTTQATGVVKSVFVKNGDTVTAGQAITEVSLDGSAQAKSSQNWASYLSAKSTLDGAQATAYSLQAEMFAKWRVFFDLAEGDSYDTPDERTVTEFYIPEKEWLAAEAKYKNQQNVILAAQASLNSSWLSYRLVSPTIYAPASGTISDITVVPGMVLTGPASTTTNTSNHIATIISASNAIVSVNLSEVDVTKVQTGAKATVTADAFPGKIFSGTVAGVNTSGVVEGGVTNFPTTIVLEGESGLLPNMAVTAVITLAEKQNVLIIPSAAITRKGDAATVRVMKNGKITDVPVETGLSSDTEIEIISGLSEGDVIIVGTTSVGAGATQTQGSSPFGVFRIGGQGTVRSGTGTRQAR